MKFIIPVDIYSRKVLVFIGKDFKNLAKFIKQNNGKQKEKELKLLLEDSVGYCFMVEANPIVWLEDYPKTYDDYDTVSHELFHATACILDRANMKLSSETIEAYCYLNGYLNGKFWELLEI